MLKYFLCQYFDLTGVNCVKIGSVFKHKNCPRAYRPTDISQQILFWAPGNPKISLYLIVFVVYVGKYNDTLKMVDYRHFSHLTRLILLLTSVGLLFSMSYKEKNIMI